MFKLVADGAESRLSSSPEMWPKSDNLFHKHCGSLSLLTYFKQNFKSVIYTLTKFLKKNHIYLKKKFYSSINKEPSKRAVCECVWQGEAVMLEDDGGIAVKFFCTSAVKTQFRYNSAVWQSDCNHNSCFFFLPEWKTSCCKHFAVRITSWYSNTGGGKKLKNIWNISVAL